MTKSLYSLILMDEVVKEIDILAQQNNTNRSNLINQILADYVSLTTPEKRIADIFNEIGDLLGESFSSFFEPYERTLSVKSPLHYKYRPTIKYEVTLLRNRHEDTVGELKVIFRTQSVELLMELMSFIRIWATTENKYIGKYYLSDGIQYTAAEGKFFRTFRVPAGRSYSEQDIATAISNYIKMFDDIFKAYLSREYPTAEAVERRYQEYINSGGIYVI